MRSSFLPTALLIILLISAAFFCYHSFFNTGKNHIVYLDNVVVFSEFNLAKDIKTLHQNELKIQKNKVDSLIAGLQALPETGKNENLERAFIAENNKLREMGDFFSNDLNEKVWERVNLYVKEFGEEHDYPLILGTLGNGNIMHADNALDVTAAFLEYANKKYEGK